MTVNAPLTGSTKIRQQARSWRQKMEIWLEGLFQGLSWVKYVAADCEEQNAYEAFVLQIFAETPG